MLKTKKSKIIIGAAAILAVLAASSIWVMANLKSNSVDDFGYRSLAQLETANATLTQLDHIIQDSIDPENGDASFYNVSIIVPGSGDIDAVKTFFTDNDGFRKYVVNDNRTIDEEMNPDKVRVTIATAAELKDKSPEDIAAVLGSSDLIYLYSGGAVSYTGDNAIGENLYSYLHNYAFGLNKPLIMNYYQLDSGSEDDAKQDDTVEGVDSNAYKLTNNDFKNSWKRTNTTKVSEWTKDTAAADVTTVLTDYISSPRSIYVPYTLNNATLPTNYADWSSYWKRNGDADPTLHVLYIHGDNADPDAVEASIQAAADWMVGDGKNYTFNTQVDQLVPSAAVVEGVAAGDLTPESFYGDDGVTKKYDYILISPDTYKDTDLTTEVVAELIHLSEDKTNRELTYILFGTLTGKTTISGSTGGSSSGGNVSLTIDTSTNFGKLIDLSITTNGYAKKSNVLVVGVEFMNTMAKNPASNPNKITKIVTLINKSTYRTHAGNGSGGGSGSVSTTAYRVLELQPCYPIDLEMALNSITIKTELTTYNGTNGQGNYYTIPGNVINTSEIDDYLDENGKMKSEYYQWDLSKAKLAYALNMSADNIELVQMSTEEFITTKADVTDSYDLIYIGGNKSALKASGLWNNYPFPQGDYDLIFGNAPDSRKAAQNTAAYTMYSHTGELTGLVAGQTFNFRREYESTVLNANDITFDRLESLKAYIDSGMPIVFSNEIWSAYESAKPSADGYLNKYIDPDSNVYALLEYAEQANAALQWNIKVAPAADADYRMVDYWTMDDTVQEFKENPSGFYGSASKVTVFNDYLSTVLYEYVYQKSLRPKFSIDTNAVAYSDSDASTKLNTRDLQWTVELLNPIEGRTYQAVLLTDKDDNAEFDLKSEALGQPVYFTDNKATLTYTYPASDFGAFSWKIVVADVTGTTGGISEKMPATSYSAISMIARSEDQPKKEARVLEIMPILSSRAGGQDGHTLYLDSNIQQAQGMWRFRYSNYLNEDGTVNKNNPWGYAPVANTGGKYYEAESIVFAEYGKGSVNNNTTPGLYQPKLSLNRYEATGNFENWTYNYADLISDDFTLSLDIMYIDDLEYYAEAVRNSTQAQRDDYLEKAEEAKKLYDDYNTEGTVQYEALHEAEEELRQALINIRDNGPGLSAPNQWGGITTANPSDFDKTDIDGILETGDYFRFFFNNTRWWGGPTEVFYNLVYEPYMVENDKMIDAYRRYIHYSMLSYGPDEYLRQNFDVIVIGFYDDANGQFVDFSTDTCEDLMTFLEDNGSLLMTHDNMTKDMTKGSINLTTTLRSYVGMDRFGDITIADGTDDAVIPHYKTTNTDKYFFSNLSRVVGQEIGKSALGIGAPDWNSRVNSYTALRGAMGSGSSGSKYQFGYPGFTDCFIVYETRQASAMPYIYAEFQIEEQIKWNLAPKALRITGTTKATQVNRGVVTTYPYYVASDLRISPTHNQAYTLDMENDQVTVWYTFAADSRSGLGTSGGDNYSEMKNNSSLYAASPKDGMDSYFIYSIGNVTYCGAGHSLVTGDDRDNNDERKLFLNVLVKMARRSGKQPEHETDIILYDPDGTTKAPGNVVKYDLDNGYYINITSNVTYPEFAFSIDKSDMETIKNVQIFYDLDYGMTGGAYDAEDFDSEAYIDDAYHVLIPPMPDIIDILNRGEPYIVGKINHPALVTKKDYFDGRDGIYGGQYTYLVIRVELDDGTILTKRIKIRLVRDLLDLT